MLKACNNYLRISAIVALIILLGRCNTKSQDAPEYFKGEDGVKNYTHLNFQNTPDNFRFAVIGDHTGGHRAGVFPATIDMLNLMQPEFVINVGDLIEGYVEDEAVLKSMWEKVDEDLNLLKMPFFFVPGNHDLNFDPSEKVWFDRQKTERSYSHFIYKDVLFLLISTEDPPKKEVSDEMAENYANIKAGKTAPEEAKKIIMELEEWAGQVSISDAQVEYFNKVLETNPQVRWTFAFMHTPAWEQQDMGNFEKIESLLADRDYTIFAGHTHTYKYIQRKGHDYITMGMSGAGVPGTEVGHMDHMAWVTLTDEGPVVSNLLLNGIMEKRGATPTMQDYLIYHPRQITQTGQSLGILSVPNLRDMGGYKTSDGAIIKSGMLYRSNQLSGIKPDDMKKIEGLKLKNSFDLRTKAERDARPEELPEGTNYVVLDVLADADQAGPAMLEKLMQDPPKANEALGGGKAAEGFKESYRQFVSLPSAQKEFSKLFVSLGDKEQLPALFHCTTGKDRTGWAAAAFFTLVGVPEDQIYEDYLRSNDYILPLYKKVIDGFVAAGGEESIPLAILGVKKEYLDAAFDEMESKYGTIENYFSEGLGIDADQQKAIKALYLGYQ